MFGLYIIPFRIKPIEFIRILDLFWGTHIQGGKFNGKHILFTVELNTGGFVKLILQDVLQFSIKEGMF